MDSLQNSCSSSNELERQASLDRLGADIKNLNLASSPATVTSQPESPDLAEQTTYGQILSCDDPNQKPYTQPDLPPSQRIADVNVDTTDGVEQPKEPVSADEVVPSIYMHPSVSDDDEVVCIMRLLQNSRYCSYRTNTTAFLPCYIPPDTLAGKPSKPFFGLMGSPSLNPRNLTEAVTPVQQTSGLALTGKALLWACARSAELIPQDPVDVMTAFGIWSKVMYLLNRIRVAKSKPEQSSRNHHLRYFILDLKVIERELNQICPAGQNHPCVLGSGKYSFADYAVARAYELLLDDTSFFRLPYTRQKKYARIIEIALNIHLTRSNQTGAMIQDFKPDYQRPSPTLNTWEEIVWTKLNRQLFYDGAEGVGAGGVGASGVGASGVTPPGVGGPTTGGSSPTTATTPYHVEADPSDDNESDFDARSESSAMWLHRSAGSAVGSAVGSACPFTNDFSIEDLKHVPRVSSSEFIYFCDRAAPLREFLYKFGVNVAKREAVTWRDPLEELWTDTIPYHKLGMGFERENYKFAVIFAKPNKHDRCCWSLAEMFSHKSLYHQDSIAEKTAIEILEKYLHPGAAAGAAVPRALLLKLEGALKFEAQSRMIIPAMAIEVMKRQGEFIDSELFPQIHKGLLHDPAINKFITALFA